MKTLQNIREGFFSNTGSGYKKLEALFNTDFILKFVDADARTRDDICKNEIQPVFYEYLRGHKLTINFQRRDKRYRWVLTMLNDQINHCFVSEIEIIDRKGRDVLKYGDQYNGWIPQIFGRLSNMYLYKPYPEIINFELN